MDEMDEHGPIRTGGCKGLHGPTRTVRGATRNLELGKSSQETGIRSKNSGVRSQNVPLSQVARVFDAADRSPDR